MVGSHVNRIGRDRHGSRESDLLPARCGRGDGSGRQLLSPDTPQSPSVRAGVDLIETNTRDEAIQVRSEFHSEFDRVGIVYRWRTRNGRTGPGSAGRGRAWLGRCREGPRDVGVERVAGQILDPRIHGAAFYRGVISRQGRQRGAGRQGCRAGARVIADGGGHQGPAGVSQFKGGPGDGRGIDRLTEGDRDGGSLADVRGAVRGRRRRDRRRRGIRRVGRDIGPGRSCKSGIVHTLYGLVRKNNRVTVQRDGGE